MTYMIERVARPYLEVVGVRRSARSRANCSMYGPKQSLHFSVIITLSRHMPSYGCFTPSQGRRHEGQ